MPPSRCLRLSSWKNQTCSKLTLPRLSPSSLDFLVSPEKELALMSGAGLNPGIKPWRCVSDLCYMWNLRSPRRPESVCGQEKQRPHHIDHQEQPRDKIHNAHKRSH